MAEVINMPRLSDTMEEGTVASWLKKVGDKVAEGDILAEIETDKATMEFESFYEGTLLHIGIAEGETANVDTLLAQTLSERRAGSVGQLLISQGIVSGRVWTTGYGERYAIASNDTDSGRQANRRVELELVPTE